MKKFYILLSLILCLGFRLTGTDLVTSKGLESLPPGQGIQNDAGYGSEQIPTASKFLIFSNTMSPGLFDSAYYLPIQSMPNYSGMFTKAAFDDNFFQSNPITNFDLVVIPLGDYAINVQDPSKKHQVHKKVLELISAGKKVLIIGRLALWWAFNNDMAAAFGKDPEAQSLLADTLGISYIGTKPIIVWQGTTGTYTPYVAKGTAKDPIGMSYFQYCNITYSGYTPIRFYESLDVFKSKDMTKYIDIEHYQYDRVAPISDSLLGIRVKIGEARVVFLSYALENIAQPFDRDGLLQRSLDWLNESAPKPGAQIEKMQSELNFGDLTLGDSLELIAGFKNIGQEDLKIDSVYIDDNLFKMGGFVITDGNKTPIVVKSGDISEVKVRFKPSQKANYMAFLTVKSNSVLSSTETVDLRGGGFSGTGANISTTLSNNTLDFGKVKALQDKPERDIPIWNRGTQILTISIAKINPANVPFVLVGYKNDVQIDPGSSYNYTVRFQPVKSDTTYSADCKFSSDAVNFPEFIVKLQGATEPKAGVYDESISSDGSIKLKIVPNPVINENSVIEYSLNSNSSRELTIQLLDIEGKTINVILSENVNPGEYKTSFNFDGLAAGQYYLVANSKSAKVVLPMIILK